MSCLADAERASLFLVEGRNSGRPSLVSKIFDVHAGTNVLPSTSGDSRIPWGQGILGHVAETGEVVNLRNVKEVSEFCGLKISPFFGVIFAACLFRLFYALSSVCVLSSAFFFLKDNFVNLFGFSLKICVFSSVCVLSSSLLCRFLCVILSTCLVSV